MGKKGVFVDVLLKDKQQAVCFVKQWLRETLERAKGFTVPREELYQQYLRMCEEERFESTSRSGFGRIVNQAFPRITSRRLGARTVNKMHYNHMRFISSANTMPNNSELMSRTTVEATTPPTTSPNLTPPQSCGLTASSPAPEHPSTPATLCALPEVALWAELECLLDTDNIEAEGTLLASDVASLSSPTTPETSALSPSLVGHCEPFYHPWAAMPMVALLDMSAAGANPECTQLVGQLSSALSAFMYRGDLGPIEQLTPHIFDAVNYPHDPEVYDCVFVLAWWRRFVSYDLAQGNRQCRQTLEFSLCRPGASVSYGYLASQQLFSESACGTPPGVDPATERQLVRMLHQCQEQQALGFEPSIWMVLQRSVAQALLFTHHSDAAQLAQLLWATTSESVMALCLHELDSRHMLSVALNVLCERGQGERHPLTTHMLLMVRRFPGVYSRLLRALSL